jgi:ATP-dependent Clp protease ATP-binding subunit ClpA
MRLPRRQRRAPEAKTGRPAERFLDAGADEARRLGHSTVGTEHVLLALTLDPGGGAASILRQLDVSHGDIAESPCLAGPPTRRIDADALATLGIDLESVRERLDETFGPGALEQTRAGCLGIMPRLKMALAYAVDYAGQGPVHDEHVLLGLLNVQESLAAHVLSELGVTLPKVEAIVARRGE